MTGKVIPGSGGPRSLGRTERTSSEPNLNVRSKSRQFVDQRPLGSGYDIRTALEGPRDVKDKYKWWRRLRFTRHDARIVDTMKMLEDRNALTAQEKDWIVNLGKTNKAAYDKLGDLLSVPRFWTPSQHGIFWFSRRKLVRMQTLKAAVHEAFKTARSDRMGSAQRQQDKMKQARERAYESQAIDRAIKKAGDVRYQLNRTVAGKKLRLYKLVTPQTLANPEGFYKKMNRKVAFTLLADTLYRRSGHDGLGFRQHEWNNAEMVYQAADALVDQKLLDAKSAYRLLWKLKTQPMQIYRLMKLADRLHQLPDRRKARALLLLTMAHTSCKNAEALGKLLNKHVSKSDLGDLAAYSKPALDGTGNEDETLTLRLHEWLSELPDDQEGMIKNKPSHKLEDDERIREAWIYWATGQYVDDDVRPNDGQDKGKTSVANAQEFNDERKIDIDPNNTKKDNKKKVNEPLLQQTIKNERKEDIDQDITSDDDGNNKNEPIVEDPYLIFDPKNNPYNPLLSDDDAEKGKDKIKSSENYRDEINKDVNLNEISDPKNRADEDDGYDASLDPMANDNLGNDGRASNQPRSQGTDNLNNETDVVEAEVNDIIQDAIKKAVATGLANAMRGIVMNVVTGVMQGDRKDDIKDDIKDDTKDDVVKTKTVVTSDDDDDLSDDTGPVDRSLVKPTDSVQTKNDDIKIIIQNLIKTEGTPSEDEADETGNIVNEDENIPRQTGLSAEELDSDNTVKTGQPMAQGILNVNDPLDEYEDKIKQVVNNVMDDVIADAANDDINPDPMLIVDPQNHSNIGVDPSAGGGSDYERRIATTDGMWLRDNDSGSNAPPPDYDYYLATGTPQQVSDSSNNNNNNNEPVGPNQPSAPVVDDDGESDDVDLNE